MFNSLSMHKASNLCKALLCLGVIFTVTSCSQLSDLTSQSGATEKSLQIGTSSSSATDVFVLSCLSDLISGFDYNLYEDSACTNKTVYNTASYFMYIGNDKYYFSNVKSYDASSKTLLVEVIKNGQMDKDQKNFIFSSSNGSYLTTLKIEGISAVMTGGSVEVYENEFHSTDFKKAWNEKSSSYNKAATLYYIEKTDFTKVKALPDLTDVQYYLLDAEGNYVKTYDEKNYAVKFLQYDIERSSHTQNLYQITSDDEYYYFGFSSTAKDSYNSALLDNYLGMPAIVRVKINSSEKKITISDSIYLSQAKPTFNDITWTETEYTLTDAAPSPAPGQTLPAAQDATLEQMQALAKSLTGDYYWKNADNPNAENSTYTYRFWFGTKSSAATIKEFFYYVRLKGMVKGAGKYNNNTITQPADDLYTDEIFTDGTSIYVIGHLATSTGNAAPKGAVYAPNDADAGKFALWVISSEGVKTSQLFDTFENCKNGSYTFTTFTWK